MVCTSRAMAGKVSAAGADKMEAQGYGICASNVANAFYITKPDAETTYTVEESEKGFACNCAFFMENACYGVCKHIIFTIRHKDESECCDLLAAELARPIDCEEIDPFAYLNNSPRIIFPIADIPAYREAASLPDLTAAEREELCYDFDRLYKRTI